MRLVPSALILLLTIAGTAAAQEPGRLTTASNVRLRAAAEDTAQVVASVPLGTELVQLDTGGEGATWLRVRTAGGPDGWLPARLTRRFKADTRLDIVESLVRDRLARQGDSFAARVELVSLVERTLPGLRSDPEPGGRFALLWLAALDNVAIGIPRTQSKNEPYASWLSSHRAVVFYNEIAGRWSIQRQAILDLHGRHRDTSVADDIAWFAVTNGLPGECEGFVACYLRRMNELQGTYLRLHSAGRHVDEAVGQIAERAAAMTQKPYFFDPARDCAELVAASVPLGSAVAATRADARTQALGALDRLRAPCKEGPASAGLRKAG
jgi:SH3 domain-containing protein